MDALVRERLDQWLVWGRVVVGVALAGAASAFALASFFLSVVFAIQFLIFVGEEPIQPAYASKPNDERCTESMAMLAIGAPLVPLGLSFLATLALAIVPRRDRALCLIPAVVIGTVILGIWQSAGCEGFLLTAVGALIVALPVVVGLPEDTGPVFLVLGVVLVALGTGLYYGGDAITSRPCDSGMFGS